MMMNKRLIAVLLLMTTLMTAACPMMAFAENEVTTPTEVPMESVSPYRIVLTAPGGWSNNNGAVMKVSVTDRNSLGWYKIEYRMNDGNWIDCEDAFDKGKAEITVRENGTFTLRIVALIRPYKNEIKSYCSEHRLQCRLHDNALHIISEHDFWRVIVDEYTGKLALYHRSTQPFRKKDHDTSIPLYHRQSIHSSDIMSILAIITNHDDYRVKSGTGLQSSTKTLPHSTKRQRKIANQVEKQNRRKKISHVLAMIEELEQIK